MWKPIRLVLALLVTLSLLVACSSSDEASRESQGSGDSSKPAEQVPIKMGAVLSIKGLFEGLGGAERFGFELAVQEINSQGGILGRQVELVVYDDEGDTAKSQQLVNRLIHQDKVNVVLGPNITPASEVVGPISEQSEMLNILFTAKGDIWRDSRYLFASVVEDRFIADAMVKFMKENLGISQVAVAYANVPYGLAGMQMTEDAAARYGVEIIKVEKFGEGDFDFTAQVNSLKAANPPGIILWGSAVPNSDANILKQLRRAGITAPVVADVAYVTDDHLEIAGSSAEGLYSITMIPPADPHAEALRLIKGYREKFGDGTVNMFAALGYDAVYMYKAAVEKAGTTDTPAVVGALSELEFTGAQGAFRVTAENKSGLGVDVFKPVKVTGGKWASPK